MTDKYTDLMIDLETLGTTPGSVIRQIGLVSFNAENDAQFQTSHIVVDPQSCLDAGMHVDWSTLRFWGVQGEKARDAMFRGNVGGDIGYVISQVELHVKMHHYVETHPKDSNYSTLERVWANSPQFDLVLLEDMARRAGGRVPWTYRQPRDLRTLRDLFPDLPRVKPEVEHHATHDAVAQAREVQSMWRLLKEKLN